MSEPADRPISRGVEVGQWTQVTVDGRTYPAMVGTSATGIWITVYRHMDAMAALSRHEPLYWRADAPTIEQAVEDIIMLIRADGKALIEEGDADGGEHDT